MLQQPVKYNPQKRNSLPWYLAACLDMQGFVVVFYNIAWRHLLQSIDISDCVNRLSPTKVTLLTYVGYELLRSERYKTFP